MQVTRPFSGGSRHWFRPLKTLLFLWILGCMGGFAFAANRTAVSLGGSAYVLPGGNFESPAVPTSPGYQYNPGGSYWSFYSGAGYTRNNTGFTSSNPSAPQGSQVLFLQTSGRITQNIDFVAGYYTFSFYAAQRGNTQASYQTVQLRIDGSAIQTFQPSGTNYQNMTSVEVYLTSGSHSIELRGLNPNGGDNTAFVDQFSATRVKEKFISGFESPVVTDSRGFEYGPTGGPWTFTNGGGLTKNSTGFTGGNPNAPEGSQVLFLQGGGSATTTVSIPATGFYRFRFKAALRANHPTGGATKNIRVTLDGTEIGEFSIPSFSYTEMITLTMWLGSGNHSLQLKGVNPISGDHTGFVDDLRLEPVHDWQDAQTWGGTVPNANDVATIPSNSVVAMRGTLNANRIVVNGHLVAGHNQNVTINAKNIIATGSSSLIEFGQDLAPYPGTANITLTASATDPSPMPAMGNNFLGSMSGGVLQFHGLEKTSWTHLGANVNAGSSTITLAEAVNWNVGDQIVIVSSRKDWNEAERRTISAISGGGTVITLNTALTYPHKGVIKSYSDGTRNWTADIRAEVGLLSHNIKVQGNATAAAQGYGGHIMIHDNAYAYFGGVELYNMGQKALLGRYPFHWHMLGDVGQGQYFKNSSVHQSYNRAITIHGTESTLVENNFFYDHIGHGVFLEDGSERFNVIRGNVTLLTKRPAEGEEVTPSDNQFNQVQNRSPSSYWITNPQNTFENNVAAGTHGTGFWFAFPTKPMGASANDPRFSSMEPHKLPLISFDGNSAHSCMSAFDIFDQLNPDHSIKTNWGWDNSSNHLMQNCLWYANDLAVYSGIGAGGPVENLIFENNVFLENKVGTMMASYSIVNNSLFVANSGESLVSGTLYAYRVYDGAGQLHNSHCIGWQASNANFLLNTGAAIKHPNHLFTGLTTDHSGFVNISLPDFDIPPVYAHANHPAHPRFWSIVINDATGGITNQSNTRIVSNQPFLLVGDEYQPSNWTRAYRSTHEFVLSRLTYDIAATSNPNVTVTRTKSGTPTAHVYYIDGFKEHHQLPFIVNEGFEYTYNYESLPSSKIVRMYMEDAKSGDDYIARFKDFGKLGGLSVGSTQGGMTSHGSLASLQSSGSSGYYRQSGGDLWVKAVATGKSQRFDISWSTNFTVAKLDTDGDEMADATEITAGRHPFTATDLAAEFASSSVYEGWDGFANISGNSVSGGSLNGTSINNGDAQVVNNDYNFAAAEVPYIKVRMKASSNTGVQMFFATNSNPGFSGSRVVTANYSGNGAWQTLTFNMAGHANWNGTVTDLRLDPVSGVGISFNIDYIKASQTAKTQDLGSEVVDAGLQIFPNPMENQLHLEWSQAGQFRQIRLVDMQGRVLREEQPDPQAIQMDWNFGDSQLSPGMYFVQFFGDAEMRQVKVIRMD